MGCVCIGTDTHTRAHTFTRMHVPNTHVHKYVHVHVCTNTCTQHTCANIYVCVQYVCLIRVCAYVYTNAPRLHIHTYALACIQHADRHAHVLHTDTWGSCVHVYGETAEPTACGVPRRDPPAFLTPDAV